MFAARRDTPAGLVLETAGTQRNVAAQLQGVAAALWHTIERSNEGILDPDGARAIAGACERAKRGRFGHAPIMMPPEDAAIFHAAKAAAFEWVLARLRSTSPEAGRT